MRWGVGKGACTGEGVAMGVDERAGKGVGQGVGEKLGPGGSERLVRSDAVVQLAQVLLEELDARGLRAAPPVNSPAPEPVVEEVAPPDARERHQICVAASRSTARRFRVIAATRGISLMALFEQMVRDLPDRV